MTPSWRCFVAALASALVLTSAMRPGVAAYGVYPPGATGIDISWPQCDKGFPPTPQSFGIIGVTGGRAFYQNPCLVSEYAWSLTASAPPSFFINLNAPAGSAAFKANAGPRGTCRQEDVFCLSYNFGHNAARLAYGDAQSQETTSSMWWLDVETENTWSDNTAANDLVIQGAVDFFRAQGRTVGIYSTAMQWGQIAGSFSPGLPNWVAGAPDAATAPSYCSPSYAFGGGTVWLVQYVVDDFDTNYSCPTAAPGVPPAPAGLQASAASATAAQLRWNAPTLPVNGYLVSDGGTQIASLNGGATSFTVTGLAPGSYHCFTLATLNASGYSPWSAWSCVTLPIR